MSTFFGQSMDRKMLLKKIGSMDQLCYIRPFEYRSGKASGVKGFQVSNGTGLDFTVLESKGLDIIEMKYKGMNLNYFPKAGLVAPHLVDLHGTEFMRSISGGMLYTCGLQNVGLASQNEGFDEPFHGRMKDTPADQISIQSGWEQDDYVLQLSGELKEAAIFRDHLVLSRTIRTKAGAKSITISDRVENQGFEKQSLMLMYHVNVGYPILDEGSRVKIATKQIIARDPLSDSGIPTHQELTGPINGYEEQVFLIQSPADAQGWTGAAVINDRLQLGLYVKYNIQQLPKLVEWKSMRSGDYALGIMPSTGFVKGREYEKEHGSLRDIEPFETLSFDLEIGVLDGKEDVRNFEKFIDAMK
jgi:hypothetical protein